MSVMFVTAAVVLGLITCETPAGAWGPTATSLSDSGTAMDEYHCRGGDDMIGEEELKGNIR